MEKIKCPLGHEQGPELEVEGIIWGHDNVSCPTCGIVFDPNVTGREVLKKYLKGKRLIRKFRFSTGPFGAKAYARLVVPKIKFAWYIKQGWEEVSQ